MDGNWDVLAEIVSIVPLFLFPQNTLCRPWKANFLRSELEARRRKILAWKTRREIIIKLYYKTWHTFCIFTFTNTNKSRWNTKTQYLCHDLTRACGIVGCGCLIVFRVIPVGSYWMAAAWDPLPIGWPFCSSGKFNYKKCAMKYHKIVFQIITKPI